MTAVECVLDCRSLLGEGALWDPVAGALWWVDIKGREIHRFDPGAGRDDVWPTPDDVGSLAVRQRGGLVVAMGRGFSFFDPASGGFAAVVEPEADQPENRFNDGKPDRQGRFFAGSLHDPETRASGGLYRLDPDLTCRRLVSEITASNGLAFSPDNTVLYYADSAERTVWAFDLDRDSGDVSNRRVFLTLGPGEGAPDGAAVDSDGCYWLTRPDAWSVARYDPTGRLDRVIAMPVAKPSCVAFGDSDLRTLYVTSMRWAAAERDLAGQPHAGSLFAVRVAVPGLPDACFAG